MEQHPLFHGDVLTFSDNVRLLVHIHQNRDITCDDCEPGRVTVTPSYETLKGIYNTNSNNNSSLNNAKENLKTLKKKYGLDGDKRPEFPDGYRDRALERQKEVGSDNPYEKTAAGSALDMYVLDLYI